MASELEDADVDRVPLPARLLTAVLLGGLVFAGLWSVEAWPLTGWRLFSAPRTEQTTTWVLEGVDTEGTSSFVGPAELPVAYRQLPHRLAEVPGMSETEQRQLCEDLAVVVAHVDPEIVELHIARDRQELQRSGDSWDTSHDLDVQVSCEVAGGGQ